MLTYSSGMLTSFYRLWIGAIALTVIAHFVGQRVSWATFRATWLGGIFLAGDVILYFSAVRETSIVDVSVIGAFQPALVLLAARRMFGERLGRWDIILIVIAMGGVSIAVLGPGAAGHHRLLGDLLAVGTLLSFTAYWLVSKRARERTAAMEYTAGVTIVAALTTTAVILISRQSLGRMHATDWIWIGLLAVVPGSGHFLMNWAHRYVDASISAAVGCISPLVASIVAIPILGQALSAVQVVGVVVGLGAIAMVAARNRQPAEPPAD